ncbi:MAG TPA: cytochrome c maturation protein CcmE [Gemmatimonadaceae bacterium]|nr:cytochrome c maturation protein CcmE [Gemmatimonadaceae bacterium]
MKARTKFVLAGLVILGVAAYLMVTAITQTGTYYLTPTELVAKLQADPSFRDVGVKVGANVVSGSIVREPSGRGMTFRVSDGVNTFPVTYRGIAPDTFTDGVQVVVEGRMGNDGTFRATTVLAKCASRYETVPQRARAEQGDGARAVPAA